jgi:hypothetical protein
MRRSFGGDPAGLPFDSITKLFPTVAAGALLALTERAQARAAKAA